MISANNPALQSWVEVPAGSDFPIQNLPFGIFKKADGSHRVASAIGNFVIDLSIIAEHGFFDDLKIDNAVFQQEFLNDFMALGRAKTGAVRNRLADILDTDLDNWDASELKDFFLIPMDSVEMTLPVKVGDYTDFYSSIEHATNLGCLFRDPENALLPNWRHIPVGYHGRASSIVVSGTPIHRPCGQTMPAGADTPVYGPCKLLDFELEVAFVVGKKSTLGERVTTADAEDYIFGLTLFNDWSARDIQKWEYVPLGPFLGKSFASTVSPWIVTLDALEPFRVPGPVQEPAVLPYLEYEGTRNINLHLGVELRPENGQGKIVSESNFKYMYWNMAQQLAHHTVNGCNLNVGDMCASGTISGKGEGSYGSLLEITWAGKKSIAMPDGSERKFIQDGDSIIMTGYCEKDGVRIGFGEAKGQVLPAN